jgi:hypothetical protein
MKKIAQGLPLKKYIGNKHKDGGIMVNALGNKTKDVNKAVAEVEGGEYNFRYNPNNPKDNYILSEQLGIAGIAKQADRFKGNNRIDYNTRTNLLNKSMKLNEMLRVQQEQQPMQMAAFGGKLKRYDPGGLLPLTPNNNLQYKTNEIPTLPTTAPKTTSEAVNTGLKLDEKSMTSNVNDLTKLTKDPTVKLGKDLTVNKKSVKDVTSGLSGVASAFGPIGQGVGAAIQLAPYAIDLGKAMFDKTSVQDLQTQGSAMRLPNTTYAKHGGKLNVVPLPKFQPGGKTPRMQKIGDYSFDSNLLYPASQAIQLQASTQGDYTNNKVFMTPDYKMVIRNPIDGSYRFFNQQSVQEQTTKNNPLKEKLKPNTTITTSRNNRQVQSNPINPATNANSSNTVPTVQQQVVPQKTQWEIDFDARTNASKNPLQAEDDAERIKEYDKTIGIPNALRSLEASKTIEANNQKKLLDIVEPPKQKDKLSEMLKSGLMLKGSAMAGSLFSALQPAQKETLRLPDFGRADDAMSRATAFSMNPALNEVEQARGKSQESIRNMATTAGQYTSNMQSVNQRAGQQAAGLRVQEQQIMNQLAGQKANYELGRASAIQQELARFDENTLMNKAATQDARVAFVENINNLGTEIMKQGNEQDIADQQDKLAVQNAKLKIIQSAFENPDIISGANLENILKMIEKGDYTNIPKLFGQPSDTRRVLKKEEERLAQQNK